MKVKTERIIDGLTYLGGNLHSPAERFSTTRSLGAIMDKYGISAACVYSFAASLFDPEHGNRTIFEAAAENNRLIPCPSVLPADTGIPGGEGKQLDGLIERGARGCCMFHSQANIPFDKRVVGPLFSALEKRALPTAFFKPCITELASLASEYPALPIVIHQPDLRNRAFMPLFAQNPNLHISLAANFAHYRGLETLSKGNGADRILFASGYPNSEPGAALTNLLYSEISERVRNKIASGNIERLISSVRFGAGRRRCASFKAPSVRLKEAKTSKSIRLARSRRPLPWDGIIDMHGHYGRPLNFPMWGGEGADLVRELDRIGVETIIVSHQASITSPEVVWGNNQLLAAIKRYRGRIAGYAVCYPVVERLGLDEIRRCIESGMTGIKMHNCNGLAYTDPRYKPVWRYADRLRLPVLLHTTGDMKQYESVFKDYPSAPILLGHAGYANIEDYVKYARRHKNIYLELAFSYAPFGLVERFVREVGADRVIYGSDAPWMSMQQQIGRVIFADLSETDKKKILADNARRVLKNIG